MAFESKGHNKRITNFENSSSEQREYKVFVKQGFCYSHFCYIYFILFYFAILIRSSELRALKILTIEGSSRKFYLPYDPELVVIATGNTNIKSICLASPSLHSICYTLSMYTPTSEIQYSFYIEWYIIIEAQPEKCFSLKSGSSQVIFERINGGQEISSSLVCSLNRKHFIK